LQAAAAQAQAEALQAALRQAASSRVRGPVLTPSPPHQHSCGSKESLASVRHASRRQLVEQAPASPLTPPSPGTRQPQAPSELEKQVAKLVEELKFKQERVKHYRDKCKQLEEGGRRKEQQTTVVKGETSALEAEVRQLQATARRLEGEKAKLKADAGADDGI
jgi:hypothetical protein